MVPIGNIIKAQVLFLQTNWVYLKTTISQKIYNIIWASLKSCDYYWLEAEPVSGIPVFTLMGQVSTLTGRLRAAYGPLTCHLRAAYVLLTGRLQAVFWDNFGAGPELIS